MVFEVGDESKIERLPDSVFEYLWCQMYGCTPTELDEQDLWRVQEHWHIRNKLAEIQERKKPKPKGRR